MKIGLVMFGHLRSYRNTFGSFELLRNTLLELGEVDVFCHTWDIEESITGSWWKEHSMDSPPPPTVDEKEFSSRYVPLRFVIEPSRQFDDSGFRIKSNIPVAGLLSMLYSQQHALELLLNYELNAGFKYDLIIKTRYDVLYEVGPTFLEEVRTIYRENKLCLPSSNPYELLGSYSDIFAIGRRSPMMEYFEFNTNFESALSIFFSMGFRELIPELCLSVYLSSKGLAATELRSLRLSILRMNGDRILVNSAPEFEFNSPLCFFSNTVLKNEAIAPTGKNLVSQNSRRLSRKYLSWLCPGADDSILEKYYTFYIGRWMPLSLLKNLAVRARKDRTFTRHVMRDFFEGGLWSAKYGSLGRFVVALILLIYSGYGLFFFRIWKKRFIG